MKAVRFDEYGGVDVLDVREVEGSRRRCERVRTRQRGAGLERAALEPRRARGRARAPRRARRRRSAGDTDRAHVSARAGARRLRGASRPSYARQDRAAALTRAARRERLHARLAHRANIRRKLQLSTRAELVRYALCATTRPAQNLRGARRHAALMTVPCSPESIASVPPASTTRSRIPPSPKPSLTASGSKPSRRPATMHAR